MNPTDFTNKESGRVIRAPQGYFAFLPAPLPPKIVYDDEMVLRLSRADAALSELAGIGAMLPNPALLISPYIRREAVLSSRIEGTRTGFSDLMESEIAQTPETGDLLEVQNYVRALEYGIARLPDLPLSLRLVREIHEQLMQGVRGGMADPGHFRRSQNWIGPSGSTPDSAPYVPPPPTEMMDCLGEWERFLHQRDRMPDLIQCALMHEHFEAIHPFLDGNGRVGRLLITLFLVERRRLRQPLLYLSDYIERNRQDYYRALQSVRTQGDWRGWLLYFFYGVEQTGRQATAQARAIIDLRERYRRQFAGKVRTLALIEVLFENPYLTARRAATTLNITIPTAQREISALSQVNILTEGPRHAWGRVWVAQEILTALSDAPLSRDTATGNDY